MRGVLLHRRGWEAKASGLRGGVGVHCGRILPAPGLGRILLGNTCVPLAFSCGTELPGTRLWLRVSLPLLLVRLFRWLGAAPRGTPQGGCRSPDWKCLGVKHFFCVICWSRGRRWQNVGQRGRLVTREVLLCGTLSLCRGSGQVSANVDEPEQLLLCSEITLGSGACATLPLRQPMPLQSR